MRTLDFAPYGSKYHVCRLISCQCAKNLGKASAIRVASFESTLHDKSAKMNLHDPGDECTVESEDSLN